MTITLDTQQLAKAKASAQALDLLTRTPFKVSPSAPIIIPILMILVTVVFVICLAFKLIMHYLHSKSSRPNIYLLSGENSFKDENNKSVTEGSASLKARPICLDQLTPQRSAQLKSATKRTSGTGALRAIARVARHNPNDRSSSSNEERNADTNSVDITNDGGDDSPTNVSRDGSDETGDVRAAQSDFVYAPPVIEPYTSEQSPYPQQERHVVRMTSIDDYRTMRPTTESDI